MYVISVFAYEINCKLDKLVSACLKVSGFNPRRKGQLDTRGVFKGHQSHIWKIHKLQRLDSTEASQD